MGPAIINPHVFTDKRGTFHETVNMDKLPWTKDVFVQQNISTNHRNVWRGLHYQYENPQGKLVRVLRGAVYDYVVDLRMWSPDFGIVRRYRLEADNTQLWVPEGFAHGFFALEPETIFMYNVFGNSYCKEDEYSIRPDEFDMIMKDFERFGRTDEGYPIIMSDKDKNGLTLQEAPKYG